MTKKLSTQEKLDKVTEALLDGYAHATDAFPSLSDTFNAAVREVDAAFGPEMFPAMTYVDHMWRLVARAEVKGYNVKTLKRLVSDWKEAQERLKENRGLASKVGTPEYEATLARLRQAAQKLRDNKPKQ